MFRFFSKMSKPVIKVVSSSAEIRNWRMTKYVSNSSVGLVPTMGALHQGHLGLVRRSLQENDCTVVSIFVNPAQFAPTEDLDQYPRTLDTDIQKIQTVVDEFPTNKEIKVFLPSVAEMYPSGVTLDVKDQTGTFVTVHGLSEQLEGSIRPHFFRGVATIVCKLLNIVGPTRAYFGQKDIQQSLVVKRMVKDLLIPTEIIVCPTAREDNMLAMSSRNEYLSDDGFNHAGILYKALIAGEQEYKQGNTDTKAIIGAAQSTLDKYSSENPDFPITIEYIALSDKSDLKDIMAVDPEQGAIFSAAIKVPNKNNQHTRLIDNIIL